jgi:hypothetical protein
MSKLPSNSLETNGDTPNRRVERQHRTVRPPEACGRRRPTLSASISLPRWSTSLPGRPGGVLGVDSEVPVPDGGVEPAGQSDDPLGPVPDPGLRVLDAEVLLQVAIGVFDGPAAGGSNGWAATR